MQMLIKREKGRNYKKASCISITCKYYLDREPYIPGPHLCTDLKGTQRSLGLERREEGLCGACDSIRTSKAFSFLDVVLRLDPRGSFTFQLLAQNLACRRGIY